MQQRNEDRILANIRSDLIAMASNTESATDKNWQGALAANLRALASLVERGKLPDPYPIFRH